MVEGCQEGSNKDLGMIEGVVGGGDLVCVMIMKKCVVMLWDWRWWRDVDRDSEGMQ